MRDTGLARRIRAHARSGVPLGQRAAKRKPSPKLASIGLGHLLNSEAECCTYLGMGSKAVRHLIDGVIHSIQADKLADPKLLSATVTYSPEVRIAASVMRVRGVRSREISLLVRCSSQSVQRWTADLLPYSYPGVDCAVKLKCCILFLRPVEGLDDMNAFLTKHTHLGTTENATGAMRSTPACRIRWHPVPEGVRRPVSHPPL